MGLQKHDIGKTLPSIEPWPRKEILKLHDGLTKDQSALAVQMRIGKIGLRHFLYGRKASGIDSLRCECRGGHQTVEHVLFACRKHAAMRRGYWDKERRKALWGLLKLKNILPESGSLKMEGGELHERNRALRSIQGLSNR